MKKRNICSNYFNTRARSFLLPLEMHNFKGTVSQDEIKIVKVLDGAFSQRVNCTFPFPGVHCTVCKTKQAYFKIVKISTNYLCLIKKNILEKPDVVTQRTKNNSKLASFLKYKIKPITA
jgi:hypothetical protein